MTILEGRLTELSRPSLIDEMKCCGVEVANVLHITSWDSDHCQPKELRELLDLTRPRLIECPGYPPISARGRECSSIICAYRNKYNNSNRQITVRNITPEYVNGLKLASELAFKDILYNPRALDDRCCNNNSTINLFRRGSFNVLSLGDVESPLISARLRRDRYLKRETDIIILAHHGADNGFTNDEFLKRLKPSLAICSADYSNQYDHPRQEVRDLLHEHDVRLMTTKTGDVVVASTGNHTGSFRATNLRAKSTEISSEYDLQSKKAKLLSHNKDTIKQLYSPIPAYRKLRRR